MERKLPLSLPGQCSLIKFPHFIGINWYFMVSRVLFCYIIVTFLSNTGCKYRFRVSFGVCHFDTLDRYKVVSMPGSDRITICNPSSNPHFYRQSKPREDTWQPIIASFLSDHRTILINSLCPSDITWWHRSRSTLAQVMAGCPAMSPNKIPWLFPDHFVVFPDHETYYRHFISALTLILQAIGQITHQK